MIILYQLARTWGIPNPSHFCVKVETYLRITKLPYEIIETLPLKAPRGKLPYILDDGRIVSDSRIILNYLKIRYGDLDEGILTSEQKGIAISLQRLLEEHLYWISMATRWRYTEVNWQTNKQAIFGGLSPVARSLAATLYLIKINSQIKGQGIGRLTFEEMFALGQEDICCLADVLGSKPYFMGNTPTSLDATAYGILVNTLACPIESPLKEYALSHQNLSAYCQRMQAEFFPELPWTGQK
jgi:glutathione S-transferase